jgi:hypothetical protein
MKSSLICATSMFALAASGSAHAYVLTSAPAETNLYDLVHDGDSAATAPAPLAIAAAALRATEIDQPEAGLTGPVDRSAAAGTAFPLVPLGAAPGTPPDNDFAMQFTGAWQWSAWQKALAIGVARIAPLIGTIDNGSSPDDKPGSTVFVAQSSLTDGSSLDSRRRPAAVNRFAASSTSTATMTLTGPANLRQRAGSGFSVAAPNDVLPVPEASESAPTNPVLPTPSYHYAPQPGPETKGNLAAASFSQAVTASGAVAPVYKPVVPANSQTGTAPRRPNSQPTSEQAAIYARLIDVTLPIDGQANPTWADGTRTFLPASVSANPTAMAARYVTSVLDAAPANQSGQTVEAFQIGQTKGHTLDGATTSVADPLRGKIMAGAGPLDNSLALP